VSAYLFLNGAITIGTVYLIFYYTERLRGPISQLRNQLADLQQAEASISRIEEVLATRSTLREGGGPVLPTGALPVEFRDVSFSYDGQEAVLQHVSFQLKPDRVLGLLGRTGSGKTTIARLLLRLYDPTAGEIRLGHITPPMTTLADVRRHVGMVTQDVQLFRGTVRDNLTFFNETIPDEKLRAVLADLGLSGWLASLPNGLETELEPGGSSLSAGQAQLLALARVFLTDPGLVILDEASSRLDPATESLIERAIDKLLANRTGIIIAHRLSTVQRADEILILDQGRIVEHGDRVVLASNPNSHFYQLLQTGLEEVLT
jgi:ATP-binding cassette subfamily B protein